MKFVGKTTEYLEVLNIDENNSEFISLSNREELTIIWFQSEGSKIKIDNVEFTFQENDILFLTEFYNVQILSFSSAKLIRWNRPFYCIVTNDSEVGCKGILFFSASRIPILNPSKEEIRILHAVWNVLEIEMVSDDNMQEEMLQMILKRIIILCTRIFKQQSYEEIQGESIDIIREFNFLIEQNFKKKHTVAEYADLLNWSAKSLSSAFKKMGAKSPLQYIKDRRMLEARRQLAYTDKSVSEIGYDIGFIDVQSFSRFFKKEEGHSPAQFRAGHLKKN